MCPLSNSPRGQDRTAWSPLAIISVDHEACYRVPWISSQAALKPIQAPRSTNKVSHYKKCPHRHLAGLGGTKGSTEGVQGSRERVSITGAKGLDCLPPLSFRANGTVTNWHFSRSFYFYFIALTLVVTVQILTSNTTLHSLSSISSSYFVSDHQEHQKRVYSVPERSQHNANNYNGRPVSRQRRNDKTI